MRRRLSINAIYARAVSHHVEPNGGSIYSDLDAWELDRFWTFVKALQRLAGRA